MTHGHRAGELAWVYALFGMAVVSFAIAVAAGLWAGIPTFDIVWRYSATILLLAPAVITLWLVIFLVRAILLRMPAPLASLRQVLATQLGRPAQAAGLIAPLVLIPVIMGSFGALKQTMPIVNPFQWDDSFAGMDKLLFLGVQPWEVTHALLGSPTITMAIDRIYSLWVVLLFVAVLGFATLAKPYVRARFFLSFAGAWILIGVVGAIALSSAGPCYADQIGAASRGDYADLMARLHAMNDGGYRLGAVEWQDVLWRAHISKQYGFAMGVSAMPSMHNAITFLYLLAFWNISKSARVAAILFATIIFIGSIHLGWHYAVDGIVAWLAMAAIWWGAGRYLAAVGYHGHHIDGVNEPVDMGSEALPPVATA